jgi:hypothetical protein
LQVSHLRLLLGYFSPSWAEGSGGRGFFATVKFFLIAIAFAIVTTWVLNEISSSP